MNDRNNLILKGIGASPGVAIGKAYLFDQIEAQAFYYKLENTARVGNEIERLRNAIDNSIEQIESVKSKLLDLEVNEPVCILDMHIMLLKDASFVERTIQNIKDQCVNAEWAVGITVDAYKEIFSKLDEYIRGRFNDVQAVGQRVIRNLSGEIANRPKLPLIDSAVIIVARDLSPADTAQMKIDRVQGFVTDAGSQTSHTTIVARSLEIPAVVGMEMVTKVLRTNDDIIVDGTAGLVIVNPDADLVRRYEAKKQDYLAARKDLLTDARLPAVTKDGYKVKISCNIEFPEEIPSAIECGAEGIGLYRTEFLYINRQNLASEQEHIENYQMVIGVPPLEWATIRTFDLGGDKFFSNPKTAKEMNPQMGLRAIRFCLKEEGLFRTQLRAILRTAGKGKTKILFPMISSVEEIREAKNILANAKNDLMSQGIPVPDDIKIGVMIEVPCAVMIADELAQEVDFFSIGTNDLIQYSLAIDRINEHVTYLYEPLHPAVIRLIKRVVDAGHNAGIEVAMCGEMAGDPMNTVVLLAMRIDEMSMYPLAIPRVKKIIRATSLNEADILLKKIMPLATTVEIRKNVEEYMHHHFGKELFTG